MTLARPEPPALSTAFAPAPELEAWARATFIDEHGPLANPEHRHLEYAEIGIVWAGVPWIRRGRETLGTAELSTPVATFGWKKERLLAQLAEWFPGRSLDFLVTIWAQGWASLDDRGACALMEHELLHCGQARDEFGGPKFTKEGRPVYALRGHDLEEFSAIAARYGAWSEGLREMQQALASAPVLTGRAIAGACGTCRAA